jgi:hypothetical protein
MTRYERPWNSDSESSGEVEMSDDTDQCLIDSLKTEVETLKKIIKLLLEKDKHKSAHIQNLHQLMNAKSGMPEVTSKILEVL